MYCIPEVVLKMEVMASGAGLERPRVREQVDWPMWKLRAGLEPGVVTHADNLCIGSLRTTESDPVSNNNLKKKKKPLTWKLTATKLGKQISKSVS